LVCRLILTIALVALVPNTTSVRGSRFEVSVPKPFLKSGAFDAQGLAAAPWTKLIRRLGRLGPAELASVEDAVRKWLGL
jgi:mRNA interferase MazF